MDDWLSLYNLVVKVCVYLAIAIYFLKAENNDARFKLLIVVAGFFTLSGIIGDEFLAQFFLGAWLVVMNVPMMIPRNYVLAALVAAALLRVYSPAFIAVSAFLYIIIMWGFLWGAVKKAGNLPY